MMMILQLKKDLFPDLNLKIKRDHQNSLFINHVKHSSSFFTIQQMLQMLEISGIFFIKMIHS